MTMTVLRSLEYPLEYVQNILSLTTHKTRLNFEANAVDGSEKLQLTLIYSN